MALLEREAVAVGYPISEAAKRLGIHANTLRAYADAGEISYTRRPGGHRRFSDADLQAFRESHTGRPVQLRPDEVEIEP